MSGSVNYPCSRHHAAPFWTTCRRLNREPGVRPTQIQQRATVEIVVTENSKIPPKKTIEDPPEYGAASGDGTSSSWSARGKRPEAESQENLRGQLKWTEQRSGGTGAGYQQNGQSAVAPSETGDQAKETAGTKD